MSSNFLAAMVASIAFMGMPTAYAASGAEQVQIRGARSSMSSSDFAEVRGQYELSNGSLVSIEGTRLRPTVQIDSDEAMPLVMTGPAQFTNVAGTMRVDLHPAPNGIVTGLTLTQLPQGRMLAAARP